MRALSRAGRYDTGGDADGAKLGGLQGVPHVADQDADLAHDRCSQPWRGWHGAGRKLGDRSPYGGELCDRRPAVHAFALVSVQVRRAAVGDLFEQQVDISPHGSVAELSSCLAACRCEGGSLTARSPPLLQLRSQCAPCPEQMATDRRYGAADHVRDLGVR